MQEYVSEFLEKYSYPKESFEQILSASLRAENNIDFLSIVNSFYEDLNLNAETIKESLEKISTKENINIYTLNLLFFIYLSKQTKEEYEKQGIDEKIYYETIEDLKYKTIECKDINDVWGISTLGWSYQIFRLKTFKLGRLEYNINEYYSDDAMIGGINVKKGDDVIFIHIPSSGEPFDKKTRLASYERAYYFYKDRFKDKEPIFCSSTWLLFLPNKEILGKNSNTASFIDDFKIVKSYEYTDRSDLWRIFGNKAELPARDLPRDTSMQRAYADWIEKGHFLGRGIGLFLYDPINKTTIVQ